MQALWQWFSALSLPLKIVVAGAVLVGAGFLSPLLILVALLGFVVSLIGVVVLLLQRQPWQRWGIATAASFVLVLIFSGISGAIYGSAPPPKEERPAQREEPASRAPREQPTQVEETATENAAEEQAAAEQEEEPEPEPKPEPKPEAQPKPKPRPRSASLQTETRTQDSRDGQSTRFDAVATVSRVVDGDTIEISRMISGTDEVRLIGVDTPETNHPDEGLEPYGPEATAFATDALTGHRVGLEFDVERVDQYDRLLAYVYAGGEMFNEDLVEQGYAQTYRYPPNTKYANRFEEAQEEARVGGLGIWSLSLEQQCQLANHGNGIGEGSAGCEVVSDPSATAAATATATTAATAEPSGGGVPPISEEHCPPSAPIKGNADSGIYHTRSSATYDATHPEECFTTEAAAQAAGYRAARD